MPTRTQCLKAGIEGGNPQILSDVGDHLGTHSIALRPMAKGMLECAAAQGEAGDGPVDDRLRDLRAHDDAPFRSRITHRASLRHPSAEWMQLRFSDAQLVALIKGRIARDGLP